MQPAVERSMEALGMPVAELAGILGISPREFREKWYCQGGKEFSLGEIRAIARACGLTPGESADIFLS